MENRAENQQPLHGPQQEETENKETINPEAQKTKNYGDTDELKGAGEQADDEEESKSESTFKLVAKIPKSIWDNGIKPTGELVKEGATKMWGSIKDTYNGEADYYKEVGPVRYAMGRLAHIGFMGIKMVAVATLAFFINELLITQFGVSLFSPALLATVAVLGVIFVLARSYMDQKEAGTDFSARQAGAHLVEAFQAA